MGKPECPNCKTKKYINSMTKHWNQRWYLCSNCGWTSEEETREQQQEELSIPLIEITPDYTQITYEKSSEILKPQSIMVTLPSGANLPLEVLVQDFLKHQIKTVYCPECMSEEIIYDRNAEEYCCANCGLLFKCNLEFK